MSYGLTSPSLRAYRLGKNWNVNVAPRASANRTAKTLSCKAGVAMKLDAPRLRGITRLDDSTILARRLPHYRHACTGRQRGTNLTKGACRHVGFVGQSFSVPPRSDRDRSVVECRPRSKETPRGIRYSPGFGAASTRMDWHPRSSCQRTK